jgi:predicted TPR repeat methyltransferase
MSAPGPAMAGGQERELGLAEVLAMANRLQREQRYDEAEAIYEQVLQQLPMEPNTLHFLGVLRHQQGRNNEALALFELALKQLPHEPGVWLNLANVLIECGHHDDAVKALGNVIAMQPDSVLAHNNLGILHARRQAWPEAEAALRHALQLAPRASYLHQNLASLCLQTARLADCLHHSLQAHGLDRNNFAARVFISRSLLQMGRREEAIAHLRAWLSEVPDSAEAAHYLAAAGGAPMPPRASDAYVQQVFDRFADSFEVHLQKLGYEGPAAVARLLGAMALPASARVLDAGCGTGLCGPLLRPLAARLEGVDLSGGMLQRAQARGDYDALHQAEIGAFLASQGEAAWDAIVGADVLIYFGALDGVLAAAAKALRPRGVLVFTVEALDDPAREVSLAVHGRYSHAERHVRAVIERLGLHLAALEPLVLRSEQQQAVQGWVFSAAKPG